ncbi:MerR family transcriptional regulator [Pseudomonas citronellolis]|uniref:MerR family transcriptional regulator n=1 Tax=Pseudomonas citronellolis TaxID=53408 RepID=UPI0023E3C493|nr:MerR family transcriptional regulator [Pseudomonas citronellolis]MDF3931813.1 MerR family transcriptional regulator [Pseudomonas citronellolis]
MKIGELARLSGLAPSRIRFYESAGLIGKVRRQANGYREYPDDTLRLLEIVRYSQQAGFSLEEIRNLLPQHDALDGDHSMLLASLKAKVAEIEALQRRLQDNRQRLLAIIDGIENKPEGLGCEANAERMLAAIREREAKA